jgi:hypothetical protein
MSRVHIWILLVAVLVVAVHGIILYLLSSHLKALSAGLFSGVIILVVIKHLGLLPPVSALIRRHFRG